MKVLSLFSGVGGFDLGLERAGMETVFQCEWDKHATKILERHWPDVPRWDDVSTLTGKHILAHAPVIDIVAWGSPCQDLSVAGKRAGLEGSRSGLFHEGIRIIKELRKETKNVYPRISLWENVYGALNSNKGADFGVILDEMAEAGSLVQEWRVLDAQYFGVPQRRRRVFLVSVFDTATAARCPDPLLPVCEGVRRDTPTGGTPRQEPARSATQSLGSGSDIANTISASLYHHGTVVNQDANKGHVVVGENHARPVGTAVLGSEIIGSLNAVDYKWPQNQQLDENKFIVVESNTVFTGASHADYREGIGTLRASGGDLGGGSESLVTFTKAIGRDSFGPNHEGARDGKLILEPMLSFDTQFGSNANVFENQSPTLKASQAAPSVAYTLRMREGKPGGGKGPLISEEKSLTLGAATNDQTVFQPTPPTNMAVRRLTPIECERLMGWPDGWTDGQADTHRYKQCGNGVASPVATWIGQQLLQLDKEPDAPPTTTTT